MSGNLHVNVENAVAVVTLNRPPLNVLNREMLAEIVEAAKQLAADDQVRAIVLTGGGGVFAAGADLSEFAAATPEQMAAAAKSLQESIGIFSTVPQPVIAAVEGYALGGGFELALSCDMLIAGNRAVVGLPEITLGIIPGGGATQRLAQLVGAAKAKEIIWTGARFGAAEASQIGIVQEVVPAGSAAQRALELANLLADRPAMAVRAAKRAIDGGCGVSQAGLEIEAREFGALFATHDAKEGISAFLSKTAPKFQHR